METYLAHLAVERGYASNTLASYRRDLRRYLTAMAGRGRTTLAEVTEHDVVAFLRALAEGDPDHAPLAPRSTARAVSAVRGLHRFAVREGMTADDPAHRVSPPKPVQRLPKAISVEEVERLLDGVGPLDNAQAIRNRALLELLYGTGARISEAVGLAVDDIEVTESLAGVADSCLAGGADSCLAGGADSSLAGGADSSLAGGADSPPSGPAVAGGADSTRVGGTVLLHGKGDKDRIVPFGRYARQALDAYLVRARPLLASRGRGSPALFLNSRGGRMTRQWAWEVLRASAERAGLTGVSPHTLRHSFATHLLDGGADVRVVQELLGHASVTTTQVYTLVTVDKLREIYALSHPRAQPR